MAVNLSKIQALAKRAPVAQTASVNTADWFRITNATAERAQVRIYDMIGGVGVTADDFVQELSGIKARVIDLHLNSPGGDVWDGLSIYAALINHPARVEVTVDGVAASAASFIAMAGDLVTMEKPSKFIIHDAQGAALGSAAEMREVADILDDISNSIAEIYSDKAGGSEASWREAMKVTTMYSAAQAVEVGLADKVANDRRQEALENQREVLIRARARVELGGN